LGDICCLSDDSVKMFISFLCVKIFSSSDNVSFIIVNHQQKAHSNFKGKFLWFPTLLLCNLECKIYRENSVHMLCFTPVKTTSLTWKTSGNAASWWGTELRIASTRECYCVTLHYEICLPNNIAVLTEHTILFMYVLTKIANIVDVKWDLLVICGVCCIHNCMLCCPNYSICSEAEADLWYVCF